MKRGGMFGGHYLCHSERSIAAARLLAAGLVVPKLIRDHCYSIISRFRKRIPGLGENACRLLGTDERDRFLSQ
jgi:hypothetical protein